MNDTDTMTAELHGVQKHEVSVDLPGGKTIRFEAGKLAKQAHGSCIVRIGDNVVLATACANPEPREGIDFFPLTVDYREYTYAAGRIPGGFIKREGRPSEREILTSRQIDRPIRPLFPEGFRCETQVIAMVLSADTENDPDVSGINGASVALSVSDIPFHGPIGAVRVGRVNGEFVINPTYDEQRSGDLNLMVVGTSEGIVMIESGAREVEEEVVVQAIEFGHEQIKKICDAINQLAKVAGKPKRKVEPPVIDQDYLDDLRTKMGERLMDAANTEKYPKNESYSLIKQLKDELKNTIDDEDEAGRKKATTYFDLLREQIFREQVIKERRRPDGRKFDQIRDIWIEVGVLPRTHGSAIFTRGETQALVTTTLGTAEDMQRLEAFEGEAKKRFMLHYNFPPFSVGEVAFLRGAGRREIGHGALAERALFAVLPSDTDWPYAMRVVSDILESNGSSSMATVCGASLSMMDAGVPLKASVAGVAMGLVKEGDKVGILTDIMGSEDHYGDMDFKVAGTREGVTALQMDIKIAGLPRTVMEQALEQARRGRLHLLDLMQATIASPRADISAYAPRIITITIDPDKIRDVIGPGGKTIRAICESTGARINIEDDGRVEIATSDEEAAAKVVQIIEGLTRLPQIGEIFEGTVKRIEAYGAFVEILPNRDGLLHISELAWERTREVTDVLKLGDKIKVKIIGIDGSDRIKLSHRALLPQPEGYTGDSGGEERPRRSHSERPGGRPPRDRGPRRDHRS